MQLYHDENADSDRIQPRTDEKSSERRTRTEESKLSIPVQRTHGLEVDAKTPTARPTRIEEEENDEEILPKKLSKITVQTSKAIILPPTSSPTEPK